VVDASRDPVIEAEIRSIHLLYIALARRLDSNTGLGGKLFYAGELNSDGFRLVRAANIAGAASLSATAHLEEQKSAIREGVVDFLVTSLDEALRILKNEIRKCQGVAVGVALRPEAVEQEMSERGVLPDLLFPGARFDEWEKRGAETVEIAPIPSGKTLLTVAFPPALGRRTTEFESLLLGSLAEDDFLARRWFRMSPRYLDPRARHIRSLLCDVDAVSPLLDLVNQKIAELGSGTGPVYGT
jgi:urocanate hydratase